MAAKNYFKTRGNLWVLVLGFVIIGCIDNQRGRVLNSEGYDDVKYDTSNYPLLINDSTAIVYQFGHMTADKGLKLYSDTMDYSPGSFRLDDSIREKLSSP